MAGPAGQRLVLTVIVLAGAAAVGVLMIRHYGGEPADPAPVAPPETAAGQSEEVRTAVDVALTACDRTASGRIRMSGYIENTGTRDLRFVTVQSIWKNSAGLRIGGETFYALNDGRLSPGDRKDFEHSSDIGRAEKCNAEPVDWW